MSFRDCLNRYAAARTVVNGQEARTRNLEDPANLSLPKPLDYGGSTRQFLYYRCHVSYCPFPINQRCYRIAGNSRTVEPAGMWPMCGCCLRLVPTDGKRSDRIRAAPSTGESSSISQERPDLGPKPPDQRGLTAGPPSSPVMPAPLGLAIPLTIPFPRPINQSLLKIFGRQASPKATILPTLINRDR